MMARWLKRWFLWLLAGLLLAICAGWWGWWLNLKPLADRPVDAFLVLGGSIRREIHAARLAKISPQVPILISHGSDDPCLVAIFTRSRASVSRVWLEKCANSTFGNYYYALPILQQWQARHVNVITSANHLPRAQWLAQIMLGMRGIWVDMELVAESGVPGNRESWLKTALDATRGFLWAIASHVYTPQCDRVIPLAQVDLSQWQEREFSCERQGQLDQLLEQLEVR